MKSITAGLIVLTALCAAGSVRANPDMYRYNRCRAHYRFGLEKRHHEIHRAAVLADERNHKDHRGHKGEIAHGHDRIARRLDFEHKELRIKEDQIAHHGHR
jgi:hypothetical protein